MTNSSMVSPANQQRNIEKASQSINPMEGVANVHSFKSATNGKEFTLYCRTKQKMDPKTLKWAFKLAERNVSNFYKQLDMGWQPKIKQNDLNKNWARYLVAKDTNNFPVAYTMFRFDMDYGVSVLYCYEMQIEEDYRRLGLGKFIMNALEDCAKYWQMEKVILTVLKNNSNAMEFFKELGYEVDESSPEVLEKAEYEILSKKIST